MSGTPESPPSVALASPSGPGRGDGGDFLFSLGGSFGSHASPPASSAPLPAASGLAPAGPRPLPGGGRVLSPLAPGPPPLAAGAAPAPPEMAGLASAAAFPPSSSRRAISPAVCSRSAGFLASAAAIAFSHAGG